jgi:formylglycine-generating enzyme required for sulfatase activity
MNNILKQLLFLFISLFLLSCSKDLDWRNPFDPDVTPDVWAPSNLRISPVSSTKIWLTWIDNCDNEQGFKISRKVGNGEWIEDIATVNENVIGWTDSNAPCGAIYYYKIKAYAGSNNSIAVEDNYDFKLSAPTSLSITPQSINSLKLTWHDTNQYEHGYKISRKVGNGEWLEDIATVSVNVSEWTDSNASYGFVYYYRVKAFTGPNKSSAIEDNINFQLSSPTSLSITLQSLSSVKLIWQDTNHFEHGFKISRKVGNGEWQEDIATVSANVFEWTDNSISSNQWYEYKLRAYYQNNNSSFSSSVQFNSNFVNIQGGSFHMGSTSGESNEQPVHSVNLTSFCIGRNEVTQNDWQSIMGTNPASGYGVGSNYPVYYINWYEILVYCNKRSVQDGLTPCYSINGQTNPDDWGSAPTSSNSSWDAVTCDWTKTGYRLPTETEWEFAARGGNQSHGYTYSGYNYLDEVAWYISNSSNLTHQVGIKAPNELGIYDMSGNVWEWVWDWYGSYESSSHNNPTGPGSGSHRLSRGGSWLSDNSNCRVTVRNFAYPAGSNLLGFRLARTMQ